MNRREVLVGCSVLPVGIAGCFGDEIGSTDDGVSHENGDTEDGGEADASGDGDGDTGGTADDSDHPSSAPESVTVHFKRAYYEVDVETLQELVHPDRHDDLFYDGFEADLEAEVAGWELSDLETELLEEGADEATVRYDEVAERDDGERWEYRADMLLRKHEGDWKFYSDSEVV